MKEGIRSRTTSPSSEDLEASGNVHGRDYNPRANAKQNGKRRRGKIHRKRQSLVQIVRKVATTKFRRNLRSFSRSPLRTWKYAMPLIMVALLLTLFSTFLLYLKIQGIPVAAEARFFISRASLSTPEYIIFKNIMAPSDEEILSYPETKLFDGDDDDIEDWDFGNLSVEFYEEEDARRQIVRDNKEFRNSFRRPDESRDDDLDGYYNFDDDLERSNYITKDRTCRRIREHRIDYQNCNSFHELEHLAMQIKFLGAGAYRQVFSLDHPYQGGHEQLVIKDLLYNNDMEEDMFEFIRMDAMVAERLSSCPRTFDIYGFCGLGILSEFFYHGDIEDTIVQESGYATPEELNDKDELKPQNDLDGPEKLLLALEMAEGIAVMHGFEGGLIVHDDIQLSQFLLNKDKTMLKINDYNRAEFMFWNEENQEYCRYQNGPGGGNWRAPEEYVDGFLNEKIDVWSLGNNMYALLTGLYPFYTIKHDKGDKLMQKEVKKGKTAFIDPRYRTRSKEEGKLVEIIERCFQFNPDDRPSIFEIVDFLREAVNEILGENASIKAIFEDL